MIIITNLQRYTSLKLGSVILAASHWIKKIMNVIHLFIQNVHLEVHQIWMSPIFVSTAKYTTDGANSNGHEGSVFNQLPVTVTLKIALKTTF